MAFDLKTAMPIKKKSGVFNLKTAMPVLELETIPEMATPVSELSAMMPTPEQWKSAGLAAPKMEKSGPTLFELIGIPSKRYSAGVPIEEKPEWFTRMEAPIFGFFKKATDIPFHLFGQFGLDTETQRKDFKELVKQEYEDKLPSAVYAEKHPAGLWLGETASAFVPYILAVGTGAPLPLSFGTIGGLSEAARQIGMPEEELMPLQRGGKIVAAAAGGVISGFIFAGARMAPSMSRAIYEISVGSGATTITESLLQDLISKRPPNVPQALLAGASQMITMALVGIVSETMQYRGIVREEAGRLVRQGHPRVLRDPNLAVRPGEKISYRKAKMIVKEYGGRKPSDLSPHFRNKTALEQKKITLKNVKKYAEELGVSEAEVRAFLETKAPRQALSRIDMTIAKRIDFLNRKKVSILDDRKVMQLMRMEKWIRGGMSPGEAVVLNEVYSKMQPRVTIEEVTDIRVIQVKQAQAIKGKIAARIVKEGQVIRGVKGEKLAQVPPIKKITPVGAEVPVVAKKPPEVAPEVVPEVVPELKPLIEEAKGVSLEEFITSVKASADKESLIKEHYDIAYGEVIKKTGQRLDREILTDFYNQAIAKPAVKAIIPLEQIAKTEGPIMARIAKRLWDNDIQTLESNIGGKGTYPTVQRTDFTKTHTYLTVGKLDDKTVNILKKAGFTVKLDRAQIQVGPEDWDWEEVHEISFIAPKGTPENVDKINEQKLSKIADILIAKPVVVPLAQPEAAKEILALIDKGISATEAYLQVYEKYPAHPEREKAIKRLILYNQLPVPEEQIATAEIVGLSAEQNKAFKAEIAKIEKTGVAEDIAFIRVAQSPKWRKYGLFYEVETPVRIDQRKADMEEWSIPTVTDKLTMTERDFLQKYITEKKSLGQIAAETYQDITDVEKLEKWTYAHIQKVIEEVIKEQYADQFEKKALREEEAKIQRAIKAGKPRPAKPERQITGVGNGSVISTRKDIDYAGLRETFNGMPFPLLGNKAEAVRRLTEKFRAAIRSGIKNVYDLWGGAKGYRSGLFPDIPAPNYHLNELSDERNNYYRNVQDPKTQPKIKAELEKISAAFEIMMKEAFGLEESVSSKEFLDKLNTWLKMGMERKRYFFAREVIQEWGDVLYEEARADKFKSPESSAKYYFLENTSIFGISERGWSQGIIRTSRGDSEFLNIIEKIYRLSNKLDTELNRDQGIPLTKEDAWKAMGKLTENIKAGKVNPDETVVLVDPQYLNPSEAQGTYSVGLKDTTFKGHKENLETYLKPLIDTGVKIIYTNNVDTELIQWLQDNNLPYNIQERIGAVAERRGRNEIISFIGFSFGPEWTVGPVLPGREAVPGERPQYVAPRPTGQSAKFSAWLKRVEAEEREYGEAITRKGKIKQRIYANAAVRGISKAEIDRIVKKETGKGSISTRGLAEYELNKVLDKIKRVRPKRIGGREVITKRTEQAIQKARDNMIKAGELTQEKYDKILEDMDIQRPEYVGSFQFITEKRGKELLFAMRSLGNIYKNIVRIENAYKKNPPVKDYVDTIDEVNPIQAVPKLNTIIDAHHAYDSLELQTKLPFGMAFEQARDHWHEAQRSYEEIIMGVLEKGGKDWERIIADEQTLERMQQYLGYKRPAYVRGKPGYPEAITKEEKAIVDAMIEYGESVKDDIRYDRVLQWIKDGTRIPNAPAKELAKAEYIYFTEGSGALRKWLEGRSWGVITGGAYDFGEIMKGKIRLYKVKPGVSKMSKKGLISKETIQYTKYDTDLVHRFKSYVRGITLRKHLRHDVMSIKTLIETAQNLFEDPRRTLDAVNRNLLEILGQRTSSPQFLEDLLRNLYAQAARTLFLDARKGVRNLFQNVALFTSLEDALKALPLSKEDVAFFVIYVKQEKSIKYDYLYAQMKGIPFLKSINDLADLINVMGRTDTINRYVAFRMKLGAVRKALKNNPGYLESSGNLDKMMKDAGLGDMTAMERKHALNKLITEGEDGFSRYVSKAVVEKVHFLYTRFERGMAEQGNELSKVLSNLLVFRKGYVQRIILDINKLRPSQEVVEAPIAGRRRAVRSIFTAIVVATLVGQLYKWLTKDRRNPYRPDSIVGGISLGGLVVGTQEKLNDFTSALIAAMTGDKKAIAKLPSLITGSANMFLPLYDEIINLIETGTDTKNIDRRFLREMRMLIDKEYKLRKTSYEAERSLIEKMQHAAFGTEKEKPEKIRYK